MANRYYRKVGDQGSAARIVITLLDDAAEPFTAARAASAVTWSIRRPDGSVIERTLADSDLKWETDNGVTLSWAPRAGDLNDPGVYLFTITVDWGGTVEVTWPSRGFDEIHVDPRS